MLVEAVASSTSMGQVLDALNLHRTGGNYTAIKKHALRLNLSMDHWTGQAHNRGKEAWNKGNRKPLEELAPGTALRRRVLADNLLPYLCALCGISEWNERSLSLRLDHINGVYDDNRLDNLRWLCPNCDSQTDTFCGRNRKRR